MTVSHDLSPLAARQVMCVSQLCLAGFFYSIFWVRVALCAGLVCAVCAPDNLAADEREIRMLKAQVARLEKAA